MSAFQRTIFLTVIICIVTIGLYYVGVNANKNITKRLEHIHNGNKTIHGLIIKRKSYKGRYFTIEYQVNGKIYEHKARIFDNTFDLGVGDSIKLKYALDDPNYVISEVERGY